MINNLKELASEVGADHDTIESVSRRTYKDTECGAWVALEGDVITIGSIVEGEDEYADTQRLTFPFTKEAWWKAVQCVDDDVDRIWKETHGCDDCGLEDEYGRRAINPDCKTCEGEGMIL